ncbi:MAG: NAD(P)-binding domain-containing protein [bacterium]
MLETLTYFFTTFLVVAIPSFYIYKHARHTRTAQKKLDDAIKRGLTEPVSLHPIIDPTRCISTAACVPKCPEGNILGIVNGRAELVTPSKCIGHGACEASCPVEAISLVFGTERRGVELPYVKETFETNVKGIYIAGELGGMGLIRNAVTQGQQAVQYIRETLSSSYPDVFDIAVVGAGPAGLAATLQAQKEKLKTITLDQDDIGGTILSYPRQKLVMTQPMEIPLYGKVKFREILKEELLDLWYEIINNTGVEIRTKEKVDAIDRQNGFFKITSSKGEHIAQRVVLAIGRRGTPRKLGVPGEVSSKVAYRLLEPQQYVRKKVLVVGGGDSAVEAALSLAEQKGTVVTLSYRKNVFGRIKEKNEQRIEQAMKRDRVHVLFESSVKEIKREKVILTQKDQKYSLANDYVFIFIGGVMPTAFLQKAGISIQKKFGER